MLLSIATLDGKFRKSEKASFRNYIIKESEALHIIPSSRFIDGMTFIRCLKAKKSYKAWISTLIRFMGLVNDTCKVDSIKSMTRQNPGTSSNKFDITGFEQNIPRGNTWQELLSVTEYKDRFIKLIKQHVLGFGSRILPRSISFIITSREKEYFISPAGNQIISVCEHKDTDTRLALHVSKADSGVAVVCKDTGVTYRSFRNIYFQETHLLLLPDFVLRIKYSLNDFVPTTASNFIEKRTPSHVSFKIFDYKRRTAIL